MHITSTPMDSRQFCKFPTLSKNLDSLVAALDPAARELGSLQFRWISSVPSSSAISDLKIKIMIFANHSTRPAHVCGNAPLTHHIRFCADDQERDLHFPDVADGDVPVPGFSHWLPRTGLGSCYLARKIV